MKHHSYYLRAGIALIIAVLLLAHEPQNASQKGSIFFCCLVAILGITGLIYVILGLSHMEDARIHKDKILAEIVAEIRMVAAIGWPPEDGLYAVMFDTHFGGPHTGMAWYLQDEFTDMRSYNIIGWAGPYPDAAHLVGPCVFTNVGPF